MPINFEQLVGKIFLNLSKKMLLKKKQLKKFLIKKKNSRISFLQLFLYRKVNLQKKNTKLLLK